MRQHIFATGYNPKHKRPFFDENQAYDAAFWASFLGYGT